MVYGSEEKAVSLIEQMTADQNPIIREGGMYAVALAYRGTTNTKAIRKLLHFASSDWNNDVKRNAVVALGFILYSHPQQVGTFILVHL
jgi:26S proteasome regulatory subunit N2